jgi:pimeloyl-ACP methyl ester carboxylesterase
MLRFSQSRPGDFGRAPIGWLAVDVITIGPGLAARSFVGGPQRPVLLVHGLSSNARLWDEVAGHLEAAGHPVVAVDLRGHGASAAITDDEADATVAAAHDLAAVCTDLEWTAPVVAGQSWGGNVALQFAADRPPFGLALVDGGWLHLSDRFTTLDDAWEELAPPAFGALMIDDLRTRLQADHPDWSGEAVEATLGNLQSHVDGTVTPWLSRERHRAVVGSMLAHRPRELYPLVGCPVLLLVAGSGSPAAIEAAGALKHAELVEFPGGDHDLHAQHPEQVAALIGRLG